MADDLQTLRDIIDRDYEERQRIHEEQRKIREMLEQASLDRETLEHLCERQQFAEKVLNANYQMLYHNTQMINSLLEILGKRLRKDSDKLDLLQEEIHQRQLKDGLHDLLEVEVKAGGDVTIDQSRKVVDDEKSKG